MVYMDEWEYHVYLELQSKKTLLSVEETGYGEVIPEDSDNESSVIPTEQVSMED